MRSSPALLVLLVVGACVRPGPTPGSSTTLPPVTITAAPASAAEAAAMFSSCLQSAGVAASPIGLDATGRPDLETMTSGANELDIVDFSSSEFREALSECAGLLAGQGFLDLSPTPGFEIAVRAELGEFAACMRSQGVEDFPELPAEWNGTTPPFASIPVSDPELGRAIEECAAGVAIADAG